MKPFSEIDYVHDSKYGVSSFVSPMYLPLNRIKNCNVSQTIYVDHYRTSETHEWVYQDLKSFNWSDAHQDIDWSPTRDEYLLYFRSNEQNSEISPSIGDVLLLNLSLIHI